MARGNLVIKGRPGWFSRALRRLGTLFVVLAGLVVAGGAGGWLAHARIVTAVESALRDANASLSATLAAGVQYDVNREDRATGLGSEDAERLRNLALPEGAVAQLMVPSGMPLLPEGGTVAAPHPCVHGREVRVGSTRVHDAALAPALGLDPGTQVVCSIAPVNGTAGETLGVVVVHRPMNELPVAQILARDLGVLTGSLVAIAVGLVLIGIQGLSGWIRRLQAAADRHERNEATANAAGTVLVRLAPHLAYEAETDERVVDLMQTVDVISGRSGTGMRRPLDLALLLGECLDRRQGALASRDRELRRQLQPDVWVKAEPDRLALAIDHALRNAIDALGDEPGRVEVGMEASRHTVEITIRDTGAKVPHENRHRLFDTGYTTKEGRAGLGLALIRRVAVDHDGYVELRHPWSGGTILRIVLPRAKKPSGAELQAPPPAPPPMVIPEDAPAEDPVLVMPPPPPVQDEPPVPDTIADDFSGLEVAEELLSRSGSRIPSPPTAIRERTGAPKYLPGEEPEEPPAAPPDAPIDPPGMADETIVMDPAPAIEDPVVIEDPIIGDPFAEDPFADEPHAGDSGADAPADAEPPAAEEAGPDFMEADTMVLDPADKGDLSFEEEPAPDPEPQPDPPAGSESIEQQAEDEMKDFFGV